MKGEQEWATDRHVYILNIWNMFQGEPILGRSKLNMTGEQEWAAGRHVYIFKLNSYFWDTSTKQKQNTLE